MAVYFDDWALDSLERSKQQMLDDFEIEEKALDGLEVLFASCGRLGGFGYDGDALVILRRISDGQLFEVSGYDCSCYGLKGQWKPDPTEPEALRMRQLDWDNHTAEARAAFESLVASL